MDARRSSISCDIDFEKKGLQISFLRLLYSDNKHAYGMVPVPIAVIANGEGPTILLTGGTHGDEYEGQLILRRMIHELDPQSVSGRIIIMPALNYPAVLASARISPLDDGNMNRVFPGEETGSPTQAIAYFVDSTIFPLCDAAMDLHSGGRNGRFIPCVYLCKDNNPDLMARKLAMTEAFAADLTIVVGAAAESAAVDLAAANGHGVAAISTELGGGGGVRPHTIEVGTLGVYRVLRHLVILPPDPADRNLPKTRFVAFGDKPGGSQVYAPVSGLFEPYLVLGDTVEKNQVVGCLHPRDDPERTPVEPRFPSAGMIVAARVPAVVKRGDYLFTTANDISRDEII